MRSWQTRTSSTSPVWHSSEAGKRSVSPRQASPPPARTTAAAIGFKQSVLCSVNLHEHEDCPVLHSSRQDGQAVAVEDLVVAVVVRDDRFSGEDDLIPATRFLGSVGGEADVEWSGEEAGPERVKTG